MPATREEFVVGDRVMADLRHKGDGIRKAWIVKRLSSNDPHHFRIAIRRDGGGDPRYIDIQRGRLRLRPSEDPPGSDD